MDFLDVTQGPYLLTLAILILGITFLVTILALLAARWARVTSYRYRARNLGADEQRIWEFVDTGNMDILSRMTVTDALRDALVSVSKQLTGEERLKIMLLYTNLGFTAQDRRDLVSMNLRTQAWALVRSRELLVPYPDEVWNYLCNHKKLDFRWCALEYLITLKGSKSLPRVLEFILNRNHEEKGICLHLLSCIAKKDPTLLRFLLRYNEDPKIISMILRTMGSYQDPNAIDDILSNVRKNSPVDDLVSAIKATGSCPSDDTLQFLLSLREHASWVVRLYVAKGLSQFFVDEAIQTLIGYSQDLNYQVREASIHSLLCLRPLSLDCLIEISKNTEHPCHSIMVDVEKCAKYA